MKRLAFQSLSFAMILSLSGFASAGSVDTGSGRITALVLVEGDNVLRVGVVFNGPVVNPANCDTATAGLALQLNAPGRSAEETRVMLNSAQLAFMTNRTVGFKIRDDMCLTLEGFPHRVVTGIIVTN
jgi:hypothetical protein